MNLNKGLIGHWTMDDVDTDNGMLRDRSAYNNHGQLNGGIVTGDNGIVGESYDFDGTDDYILLEGYGGIAGSDPRTCVFWYKSDSDPHSDESFFMWGGSESNGEAYQTRLNSGTSLRVEVEGGNNFGETTITDEEWHHCAIVFPEGATDVLEHDLYVDGGLEPKNGGSQTVQTITDEVDVSIGRPHPNLTQHDYCKGNLDDVRLYNRELSEQEINALYNMRSQKQHGVEVDRSGGFVRRDTGVFMTPSSTETVSVTDIPFEADMIEFFASNTSAGPDSFTEEVSGSCGYGHGIVLNKTGLPQSAMSITTESASPDRGSGTASNNHAIDVNITSSSSGTDNVGRWTAEITNIDSNGFDAHFDEVDLNGHQIHDEIGICYVAYEFGRGVDAEIGSFQTPADPQTVSVSTEFAPNVLKFHTSTAVEQFGDINEGAVGIGESHGLVVDDRNISEVSSALTWATSNMDGACGVLSDQYSIYTLYTSGSGTGTISGRATGSVSSITNSGFDVEFDEAYTGSDNPFSDQKLVRYVALSVPEHKLPDIGYTFTPEEQSQKNVLGSGFMPDSGRLYANTSAPSINTEAEDSGETSTWALGSFTRNKQFVRHFSIDTDSTNRHSEECSSNNPLNILYVNPNGVVDGKDRASVGPRKADGFELDYSELYTGSQKQHNQIGIMYEVWPQ